jgi:hypothetical protein
LPPSLIINLVVAAKPFSYIPKPELLAPIDQSIVLLVAISKPAYLAPGLFKRTPLPVLLVFGVLMCTFPLSTVNF